MKNKSELEKRKSRNKELVERMKNPNDTLSTSITHEDVSFQPRKIIKKDKNLISKLFGNK